MRRILFAAMWSCLAAWAQFSDLATTDDGYQVYFASTLPLRGDFGSGVFRWTGLNFERFTPPPPADPLFPRFITFRGRPMVSGGGTVLSWSDSRVCQGGSSCLGNPTTWTSNLIVSGSPAVTLTGRAQISRNGRYMVNFQELGGLGIPNVRTRQFRDLATGTVSEFDMTLSSDTQSITSDGRLLGFDNTSMILWSPSGRERVAPGYTTGVISDNGRQIVATGDGSNLVALNLDTGAVVQLGPGMNPSISNDGLRVVFRSGEPTQLYAASTATGERHQLTGVPAVISSGVLAGFGQIAYATTLDGRILRINIDNGAVTDFVPRTPTFFVRNTSVPCGAMYIEGRNVVPSDSVHMSLDDTPVLLLSTATDEVWGQIPCETQASTATRTLRIGIDSPFESATSHTVQRAAPWFVQTSTSLARPVHQDFRGPVSPADPAQPGEVVHIWGSGFGRVDRGMSTGEVTPASPLIRLTDPAVCGHSVTNAPMEILFIGLAPSLTGVFQLDVRVPEDAFPGLFPVLCSFAEGTNAVFFTDVANGP